MSRNVTDSVRFAPNQLTRPGAKPVTNTANVVEDLPTPVRAVFGAGRAAGIGAAQFVAALHTCEKKIYDL